jgi:hypothetical protein
MYKGQKQLINSKFKLTVTNSGDPSYTRLFMMLFSQTTKSSNVVIKQSER